MSKTGALLMLIPAEQLSQDALQGLIEEFITREGTDYGLCEYQLADKVSQVSEQITAGVVVIVFDGASESVNLMTKQQYQEWAALS